ncbi:MAG: HAMP domain-containing protein [Nitrospirae bacterium]|nr:MAG: HAMP domain-containing protein [Nitrospirota bacterium]
MNLKSKYILFTTCILFVIIGAFSYKNLRLQEKEIQEDEKERVSLIAEIIKNSLVTIMLEGKGREFQKFLETIGSRDVEQVWIFRPDGTIISSSLPSQINTLSPPEHITRFKTQKAPEVFSHENNGKAVYSIITPLYNERPCQKCHGAKDEVIGVLDIEVSMAKTLQRINDSQKRMLTFFIITLIVISISLSMLTSYLVNKPITSIIDTMKNAEEGDLTVKFLTRRKDEIGKLASSLNSMLFELGKARREIEKCHFEEIQNIEKMATIGEMSSAIAHEIKNPLAGISGAIQVLAEEFSATDPRKEVITEVLNEIERLDRSVKELLVFARPPDLHPVSASLQPIIERAIRLVELQAQKQGVVIRLIPGDDIGEINVDPEQLQQVFLNLMLNALQSMPAGGTLTTGVYLTNNSDEIEVVFSDTGQGIEEDAVKNIFKPFFTTRHAGTGLGLAISRNIVEKHHGKIFVESRIGIGSTFHVILKTDKG